MDQKPDKAPAKMSSLQDEARRRALEILELEVSDDYDSNLLLSVLFFTMPGLKKAVETRSRKIACTEHFRQWLKENNLTPRDCGIGQEFVKKHIPEYSFLY